MLVKNVIINKWIGIVKNVIGLLQRVMHVRNVEERNDFSKFGVYFLLRIYIYDFVYDVGVTVY